MYIVMHKSQGEQLLFPCNGRLILNIWPRILDFIENDLLSWQQLTFIPVFVSWSRNRKEKPSVYLDNTDQLNIHEHILFSTCTIWCQLSDTYKILYTVVSYCVVFCNCTSYGNRKQGSKYRVIVRMQNFWFVIYRILSL